MFILQIPEFVVSVYPWIANLKGQPVEFINNSDPKRNVLIRCDQTSPIQTFGIVHLFTPANPVKMEIRQRNIALVGKILWYN